MAQKLIVVVGATGGQGGAVVSAFLKDTQWNVRGITRNPNSEKAKELSAKGVEVVKADLNDFATLEAAFEGANVIFGISDYYDSFFTQGWQKSMEIEYAQGTNMAKAAAKVSTLEHYIWSTLPFSSKATGGAVIVPHFEAKARVDEFIKADEALLEKTTFCFFTTFVHNLTHYDSFKPFYLLTAKKWIQFYPAAGNSVYPCLGDHKVNTGIFVRSLIQNKPPGGTYVKCAVENHTLDSYLALWGKASGLSPEPGSTEVIEISSEAYISLYGPMGEETVRQWEFTKFIIDNGIMEKLGSVYKDAQEYMSKEAIDSLVSLEETFTTIDWKAYGY
ncbi:hypothetical protein EDB81DRAFT_867995 [Dactylonectria macrodidyma]|uniref:NmrA-like domain-containing protein n=1 Tax=Dactylonectria macrodidyma TaxID=307937 RepID=A0A9P9F4F3_9HYPO|nr:hypothetical protein EDB81DRAFT_867995 [Dactylonectria macrodidyma]